MSYAYVRLTYLDRWPVVRLLGRLLAAWSRLPHVRRVILQDGVPVLRLEAIEQQRLQWSVNPRTAKRKENPNG